MSSSENLSLSGIGRIIAAGLLLIILLFVATNVIEVNHASKYLVVQGLGGGVTAHTTPGPKFQGGGYITVYDKRSQFSFNKNEDGTVDNSISIQFAEGGTAKVYGVLSWEMPSNEQ